MALQTRQGAVAGACAQASAPYALYTPEKLSNTPTISYSRSRRQELGVLLQALGGSERQPLVYTGDPEASLNSLRNDALQHYRELCGALGEAERVDVTSGTQLSAYLPSLMLPQLISSPPSSISSYKRLPLYQTYAGGKHLPSGRNDVAGGRIRQLPIMAPFSASLESQTATIPPTHPTFPRGYVSPAEALSLYSGALVQSSGWASLQMQSPSLQPHPRRVSMSEVPQFVMHDMQMAQGSTLSLGMSEGKLGHEESMLIFPPIGTAYDGSSWSKAQLGAMAGFTYRRSVKPQLAGDDVLDSKQLRSAEDVDSILKAFVSGKSSTAGQRADSIV